MANKLCCNEATRLAPGLYRLQVGVVNVVALLGPDGVLLSDAAYSDTGERLRDKLHELGGDRLKVIVCTHYHHDHVGGIKDLGRNATILAHTDVRALLSSDEIAQGTQYKAFPEGARPNHRHLDRDHLPKSETTRRTVTLTR